MKLRMKDVTKLSGQSKSKVLYYIKEGLLPKPKIVHKNLHLYDESIINRLKFIQYLQDNFSYSIEQIKTILKNNKLKFDASFDNIIKSIEALSYSKNSVSKEKFLKEANITEEEFDFYCKKGYILNCDNLSTKEIEIAKILHSAKVIGLDFSLIDTYVMFAKSLAKKENFIGSKLLENDKEPHNQRYELLFDLILKLKPYIFNNYTILEHKTNLKEQKWNTC